MAQHAETAIAGRSQHTVKQVVWLESTMNYLHRSGNNRSESMNEMVALERCRVYFLERGGSD